MYVVKEGKTLKATALGKTVTRMMEDNFQDIVDYGFTAQMEEKLDQVESGDVAWKQLLSDFYRDFEDELKAAEGCERYTVEEELTDEICPLCGNRLAVKIGRFGPFLACSGWRETECNFTMPIIVEMPGKCPKCGGRLVKRTGLSKNTGKQYTYYCCEFHNSKDERRKCDFATFDVPTKDNCPACGWTMFKKAGRGAKKPFCIHEGCSNFTPEENRGGWRKKADEEPPEETAEEKKSAAKKTTAKMTAVKKTTAKKTTTTKKAAKKAEE